MLKLVIIAVSALIVVLSISLQKTYNHVSAKELKRRSRSGDKLAALLFRAVTYGMSLDILIWLVIGFSASAFFVVLARSAPGWLAAIMSLLLLWFAFAWLPNSRVSGIGEFIAKIFTPPITWLLRQLQPLLGRFSLFIKDKGRLNVHTGLYQKEDLLDLLTDQKQQIDNRISKDELRIAAGALKFGDKQVRDIMTPRKVVKMVSAKDSVGPILLSELHDSGHSRFPVYDGKQDNIVGVLYLHDLVSASSAGKVSNLMSKKVNYVNEDLQLDHVLQAFLKTKHHLFVVVNEFEEVGGVITIEDILEQIIGKPIMDEFDKYEDLRAVAKLNVSEDKDNDKVIE